LTGMEELDFTQRQRCQFPRVGVSRGPSILPSVRVFRSCSFRSASPGVGACPGPGSWGR
jgi:hypothetical protein